VVNGSNFLCYLLIAVGLGFVRHPNRIVSIARHRFLPRIHAFLYSSSPLPARCGKQIVNSYFNLSKSDEGCLR